MLKSFNSTKLRLKYVSTAALLLIGIFYLFAINWRKIQYGCPSISPSSALSPRSIDLNETPKPLTIQLDQNTKSVAYKFVSSKKDHQLHYSSVEPICLWMYAKNNQDIPLDRPLEEKAEYILQAGLPTGTSIVSTQVQISIQPPNLNKGFKQENQSIPIKSQEEVVVPSEIKQAQLSNSKESLDFRGVAMDVAVNSVSSILLALFIGNRLKTVTEYFRDFQQTKESKDLKLFWFGTSLSKKNNFEIPKYIVINGSTISGMTQNSASESFISEEYSESKKMITQFLESVGCSVEQHTLGPSEVLNPKFFEDSNVILLTGEAHPISGFGDFVKSTKLPYFFSKEGSQNKWILCRRVKSFSGAQIEYRQGSVMDDSDKGTISLAFGTLTRLIDPDTGRIMIILNGEHGFGVSAPAYFLTNYNNRKNSNLNYLDFSKLNQEIQSYQLVFEASNSKKERKPRPNSRELHLSTWTRVEVSRSDLNSAITDLCKSNVKSSLSNVVENTSPSPQHP